VTIRDGFVADESQLAVINARIDGGLVVTAGPGTGKTFTAALRVAKILEEVEDGLPILAVSFSRAASHAIRTSCWHLGCRTGIEFSTLDSWAGNFVAKFAGDVSSALVERSFDSVIERATTLLRAMEESVPIHSHLLVDEAQDISGVRGGLVRELMGRTSMGWTLLGDVAQKIFDFETESVQDNVSQPHLEKEMKTGREAIQFNLPSRFEKALECVPAEARDEVLLKFQKMYESGIPPGRQGGRDAANPEENQSQVAPNSVDGGKSILEEMQIAARSNSEVHHLGLTTDHRSKAPEMKSLRGLGDFLRGDNASDESLEKMWIAHRQLRSHVKLDLDSGRSGIDELSGMLRVWGGQPQSTAVLVKTRANLLSISRHLWSLERPVHHEIIPTRDEDLIPGWVGEFAGVDTIEELYQSIPESLDREVILSMMKARYVVGNRFDEDALVESIRAGRVPEFLKSRVVKGVVVSTIHRVKGLEFDRVILGGWNPPDDKSRVLNESRLMFVGLTRASRENWALDLGKGSVFGHVDADKSRWLEQRYVGKSRVNIGIEVKSSDIRLIRPVPESVELVLRLDARRAGAPIRYVLSDVESSSEFGFTLDQFGEAVSRTTLGKRGKLPELLFGLLRAGSCTIAPDSHQRMYWNGKKLAVAPVLAGIVTWKEH
jgi:hypothetical protein